jgi:hypothetical protein
MEYLIKNKENVEFRSLNLIYVSSEKIDDESIQIHFTNQVNYFIVNETNLNGIVYNNSEQLINALNNN